MAERGVVGVVAIGRNEGERLERCLRSVPAGIPVVYVDSASTDSSVAFAISIGAAVVELDMTRPFTAARARNEGYARLMKRAPGLRHVQFVDGDCELEDGWFDRAVAELESDLGVAAVCGRRRERFPQASFYNRLCDEEWDTPVGEADACGGDALVRVNAFEAVGGYDPAMVAGEEPEMCHRLRGTGWRIRRLDVAMTIHDAAIYRPRQWWMRAVRSGFGYAQVWRATGGRGMPRLYRREMARAAFWTIGVLALALVASLILGPIGLLAAPTVWLLQLARLSARNGLRKGAHLLFGKFAEMIGMARYALVSCQGRTQGAILYK